ncbi:unnamed protein product [Calypogeia fissa]
MAAINDDNLRVREWENGLPSAADLTPLSHSLISRVLARAFCIPPSTADPNSDEVLQASQATLQLLQQKATPTFSIPSFEQYSSYEAAAGGGGGVAGGGGGGGNGGNGGGNGTNNRLFGGNGGGGVEEGIDEDRGAYDSLRRSNNRDYPGQRSVVRVNKNPVFGKGGGGWEGDNGQERDGGGGGGIGSIGNGNSGPELGQGLFWPGAQGVMPPGPGQYGPLGSDQGRYGGGLETGSESKGATSLDKPRKMADNESEDVDSADGPDGSAARTLKRPRLVWTPQLHKRFVDAVGHLGIKNAVPKTIMQLMNVEGLTRENVASHLQKYRLYLKRMQGLSTEGPSASDPLFASTPLPPNLTSPHFFSNHHHSRAENGASGPPFSPPAAPIPRAQGTLPPGVMGPGGMGLGALHHFGGFEHHLFSIGLPRTASQRPPNGGDKPYVTEHRDHMVNAHSSQPGPGSPPHRVLTLFPPSGH